MRQRLLDVDVLAGRAGVDRHRHVPVVGRGDQHGVDVLAGQQLVIVLGGDGLGIGQLLPASRWLSQMSQTAVIRAPGTSASARINCLAAAAGADAADVERFVGREAAGRGRVAGQQQPEARSQLFQKLAAIVSAIHG